MKPLNLVFMGTPAFALPTLQAIIDSPHNLHAVYTQPPRPAGRGQKETPTPVHQLAAQHGIPVHHPASLKQLQEQQTFQAIGADAAVVVAYGLLLPKPILQAYRLGCINVHPSALPRWRGAAPIQRTVMAGDSATAICIMQMDEGLDTGDILLQKDIARPENERYTQTAGMLHDMLAKEAAPLVLATLDGLTKGNISPQKQSEAGVTYAKKITKDECAIDWNMSAHDIACKIMGLSPHPGAYFTFRGENIKLLSVKTVLPTSSAHAATTVDDRLTIACGSGALQPDMLQRPGKKPLPLEDFLRGYPITSGTVIA